MMGCMRLSMMEYRCISTIDLQPHVGFPREIVPFLIANACRANPLSTPTRLSAPWLRRLYRAIAPAYDGFATAVSSAGRAAAMQFTRTALANRGPGAHVLLVGCGTGLSLPPLAEMPAIAWIEAVDASPAMLRRAQTRYRTMDAPSARAGFRQADGRSLPYPDAAFDLVLSLYMLDVLPGPDRARTLRSIARVLRPGGTLITATVAPPRRPVEHLWTGAARAFPALLGGAHPVDLRPMLQDTGFAIRATTRHVDAGLPSQVIVSRKPAPSSSLPQIQTTLEHA
jgi:ubiquinone/menaquinone biosynthesis C-methylase UbiE